ncbi:hypothetical protein SDC9_185342 [bioreactor metagenome]|uniref:Uncharacterized protein n=1 Tax=bioreactor metagenome TaxID=1076179 RepID=A0A645HFN1_9ZZZZ|nr:hypothetical protein [Christensenella sp.]MEA5003498.1 hypothetical protein [Christensenella sp.]
MKILLFTDDEIEIEHYNTMKVLVPPECALLEADHAVVIVANEASWFVEAVGEAAELAGKPYDVLQIKKRR